MSRTARWLAIFATGLVLSCGSLSATAVSAATTPSPSPSDSSTPQPCADPGPAPTGVTATASLVGTDSVQARLTWTPLVEPETCSAGVTEIEQVSPAGPTITAPSANGEITITGLKTLTAYTWRLRYVAGTVSQWATVSVAQVLPADYCFGLPAAREITATTPSPTSVHLEWGDLSYPAACGHSVTIKNSTTGVTVATVSSAQTGVTITGLTPGSTTTWLVTFINPLGSVTVTQPDAAVASCTADARVDSAWDGGFVVTVTVHNTSTTPLKAWSTSWPLPAGVQVSSVWNASGATLDQTFSASSLSWNGQLASGADTTFGFLASRTGSGAITPAFSCTGSPAT